MLQSRVSEVLHVDIHPAAEIGRGILMVRSLMPSWHAPCVLIQYVSLLNLLVVR